MAEYDLAIIGGGINGTALARDASGRGLRVLLVEQNDLASGTSWTSSKLIHGGLRYLEQYAFKLVHESLAERARLLHTAPHIIWPRRFVLPHHKGLRPAWLLRLGLFMYDALAGFSGLPRAAALELRKDAAGKALKPEYLKAFEYSDCCVDDVRLVVLNAVDAAARGATIRTRTVFTKAVREEQHWRVTLNGNETLTARALINAAGPWVEGVDACVDAPVPPAQVKLVKGSHIVVRKIASHDKAYLFQNADGRIVFAIPYQDAYTLIGTTDVPYEGDPAGAQASDAEVDYLCALANDYFKKPISRADIVWRFSGLRALYDTREVSAKNLSRDYHLGLDAPQGGAPYLAVYGGKLTTARQLAETALAKLSTSLPMRGAWTGNATIPGGAIPAMDVFMKECQQRWPFLAPTHVARLARAYGTHIRDVLGDAKTNADLGIWFGADLTQAEVDYLRQKEWAVQADDILWRRSKLGLSMSKDEQQKLAAYMEQA